MEQQESYYTDILSHFYSLSIKPDWWKLPGVSAKTWADISHVIEQHDPYCRGILILGLDAPEEQFKAVFDASVGAPLVKGFAVGRTIFGQPSADWLDGKLTDDELITEVGERYRRLIKLWQARK